MKILSLVLILALTISAAFANNNDDDDAVYRGEREASVTQDITLTIPLRAAVHITDTEWTLNLGNDYHIAEYCFFVPKTVAYAVPAPAALDLILGRITLASAAGFGYPAVRPGDLEITGADKGYLVCRNSKEVQKFSNTPGDWTFSVEFDARAVDGVRPVFGERFAVFGIGGFGAVATAVIAAGQVLIDVDGTGPTGGWRTSDFIEGFYFDGSEVAGTHNLVVTYTMTNF